ncbi:MAG: hypothetical protein OHK0011_01880 [Turneriella sp.]
MRFRRIIFLLPLAALIADPVGWGDPSLVDRRAEEFGVCCHEGESRLYAVTTSPKGAFNKEAPTTVELALVYTEGSKFERRVLTEVTLAAADQPFPLHPSVSALGDEILVAWQETQPSGNASGIYYTYSAAGPTGFTTKQVLPSTAGKLNAILPQAKMTGPGQHVILYQEPAAVNRFRLVAAYGGRGVFSTLSPVAEISGGTRGALFPATIRRGKRIDILYQNRAEATLIDDIFRAFSEDAGVSWGGNVRVTNNGFQNFSAQVTDAKDKLIFIWQSNPNKVWSIFAAPEGSEPIAVNDNASPSYLPAIVAGRETAPGSSSAIVAAWQDTRNGAPQIYAKFLDRPENTFVGIDHRVSKEGIAAKPIAFARLGNRPFLFYGCGPGLCVREADTTADPVRVFSRTHAIGQISKSSDAVFTWPKISDISGVESFAWVIDDTKETNPDLYNMNARATQITVPGLNGGAYYLHLKYRDKAGNVSPVTHYPFVVDSVPPSRPIITSPSHDNGIPDARQEVIVRFSAADDSGIATYRYAFAEKLPRVFTETTTSTELTFSDVPPGKYVFAVEAVDLGGNVSERAFYRIEIGVNERNDLTIRHNAEADVITRPDIAFTIQDNGGRGIREVYYLAGFDIRDPFAGKKANTTAEENIYTARINGLETGTAVISLGIVYADGTRAAPRHFYFDSNDPRARKKFAFTDIEYEKVVPVPERSPFKVGGRAELISSKFDRGILEIRLNYDTANACRNAAVRGCKPKQIKVKGFVWEIASAERIPQGDINFSGPVEFIYLQKPGQYFLNAKTLFLGPEREQFAYDSRSVDVPDVRKEFRRQLYTALAATLAFLLLIALWQRRRIAFYAGAWG